MKENKQNIAALVIIGIFSVFGIIASIIQIVSFNLPIMTILHLALIIIYVLVLLYGISGYKKPHGNMLKYLMLAFIVSIAIKTAILPGSIWTAACRIIALVIAAYVAGRLDRVKDNARHMVVVTILLAISCVESFLILGYGSFIATFNRLSIVIQWIIICSVYFIRYKEHKEAGLIDTPKN